MENQLFTHPTGFSTITVGTNIKRDKKLKKMDNFIKKYRKKSTNHTPDIKNKWTFNTLHPMFNIYLHICGSTHYNTWFQHSDALFYSTLATTLHSPLHRYCSVRTVQELTSDWLIWKAELSIFSKLSNQFKMNFPNSWFHSLKLYF